MDFYFKPNNCADFRSVAHCCGLSGFTKAHLRRDLAVSVAHALAMVFQEFREFRLGYAKV
jgi:hypothetical protein